MRRILLIVFAVSYGLNIKSQTIATARAAALGTTVTISGVVLNGAEFGNLRYVQDPTAGIGIFGAGLASVAAGASITVVGPTSQYFNLLQISPINTFTVHTVGNALPTPNVILPSALNETVEGTLVRINNSTFAASGTFAGNTAYTLSSASQTFVVWIDATNSYIVGTPIPSGPVDIIGVGHQYCASPTIGCTVGYELRPRTLSDIILLPAGVENVEKETSMIFYPNPAHGKVYFKPGQKTVMRSVVIRDMQGRIIYAGAVNDDSIDISTLQSGIYNLSIHAGNESVYSKLSIQ